MSNLLRNARCHICNSNSVLQKCKIPLITRHYAADSETEIVLPKRIPRGPTDILQALRSTIKRDPTAAHYRFHDDPYLIPLSNSAKRIYALSQESGRKTAMWIKEKHPELFQHVEADPPIRAYLPKAVYDETDYVDNETLSETIKAASVDDSIRVYQLMLNAGIEVSEENKQSLLELVCFFNETEKFAEELIEERWFSLGDEKFVVKNSWKNDGFAEQLFKELPPSGKTYSALIQGMVKFYQMEKAKLYFRQALDQGLTLSTEAYHAALKTSEILIPGPTQKWQFIEETLRCMNDNGCVPNIRTLNIVLGLLQRMGATVERRQLALKMIAEVRQFGVEPSLGSYHLLLKIFCDSHDRVRYSILKDILDLIEGSEFTIRDNADVLFFSSAMTICHFYLHDINVAYRLNNLLWTGKNYNLIGTSMKEAAYYRNFFLLLMKTEDLQTILKLYDYYVPNIYTPEVAVLLVISMNGAVELCPKVWTDAVTFELGFHQKIMENLLNCMVLNRPPSTSPPSEIAVNLSETAWSIYTSANEMSKQRDSIQWTGEMLGHIIMLCLNAENFSRAIQVFTKIRAEEGKIIGVPSSEALNLFMDACITHQDIKNGMSCVEYCSENGYADVLALAKKLARGFYLSPLNKTRLIARFGPDVIEEESKTEDQLEQSSG